MIGRNDPCPCGSGKKYKKCCLEKESPASAPSGAASLLEEALEHHQAGRLSQAEERYRRILRDDPHNPEALHRLGLLAHQLGHHRAALELVDTAVRTAPPDATRLVTRATIQRALGHCEAAAADYRSALALRPDAAAWSDLGQVLHALGRFAEAESACRESISLDPGCIEAWNNLGNTLVEQGRAEEAVACFRKVLAFQPTLALGHFNLGTAWEKLGRLDEAAESYRQALALSPGFVQAHHNLGNVLLNRGQTHEALASFDRALALQPGFAWTHDIRLCALNYLSDRTPEALYQAARDYAQRVERPLQSSWPEHANGRDPARRLKIGYVSPDFRRHSVAFFMEPVLAQHDRREVEVYCYYNNTAQDEATARLKEHADHWIPCRYLDDDALAERIRADGIDVLVDLAGHTAGNRLLAFARRPAPVQVTYLGYVATTGLSAMDWRLGHEDTDPPGSEAWNSERLYRLPRGLWCYRPAADLPEIAHETPARRLGYPTFGSMNHVAKLSEATIDVWAELLRRLPSARLLMAGVPAGRAQALMRERFAARGVAPARLELHDRLSLAEFRALHARIDLALDPFPHNGNTTTCESLYLGVPVITRIGGWFVARFGYHLLETIGLAELAARDEAEYVAIAEALANDLERLEALRRGMRARLDASPLRDEPGFVRQLEAAYRTMWRAWCESPPAAVLEAAYRQGVAELHAGRPDVAAVSFGKLLEHRPEHAAALHMLAVALLHAGRPREALERVDDALRIEPQNAGAHYNRGVILQALQRPEEAATSFDATLALEPDSFDAWNNRGLALRDQGRLEEAEASFRRALALRPDGIVALNNLGNIQRDLGRYEEALASFDRVLALKPDYASGHNNRGTVLQAQGRYSEALQQHLRAQALDPANVEAHWNEALCRLTLGDYGPGFEQFEWRLQKPEYAETRAAFGGPAWRGREPVSGRTLLLWAEQGLGDALQFCRYVPAVAALGATVMLGVPSSLRRLLARMPGVARVFTEGETLPPYDLHCPLMSLPLAFATTLVDVPAGVPYLQADAARIAAWRDRLGPAQGRRVGLAWSGNPRHKNDRQRSIVLSRLAPLAGAGVELVGVQKGVRDADRAALVDLGVRNAGEALEDFADAAALLECLDLVITVDTAVAHLAGALGKPVWILLPYAPDWRWLLGRDDTPWYPTARLYRQPGIGDWESVVRRVAGDLRP